MARPWHSLYPEGVPYEFELPNLSIYEILERSALDYPTRIAFIFGDEELTYAELKLSCDRFASALYKRGFRKGDRMAVMLPNSLEYIIAYFAIQRLGGTMVQTSVMYQASELTHLLRDSEPKWLICRQDQMTKLEQTGFIEQLMIITVNKVKECQSNFHRLIRETNIDLPPIVINPRVDVAILQYTGGTTGKPKGAMLTHFNLVSNAFHNQAFYAVQNNSEVIVGNSPLFHAAGLLMLNFATLVAATYLVVEKFNVATVFELIKKHSPTLFIGVPTMYINLLQSADLKENDLKCLKICTSGTAPMPVQVLEQFEKKSGAMILENYGMTEALVTHRNPFSHKRKIGSIGIPLPNMDCKIVDLETGTEEMPPGTSGELIMKGPQVMKGYWKNEEETKRTIRDGWLYTGDIGMMDKDGYFFIVGRKKDLIIASGYNIYPVEVEEVLYQHPVVMEACVFGVPDSYRGETVKAVIVPKHGTSVTSKEMISWCKERLATYKVPRFVEFRESLPKTKVGKILRHQLVEEERIKQGSQ
ncbi:long-chain fatty acid--CoA ligase [Sporosarcina soli]|uniref:Long-chain fatty acid--CoA ligase n=1 Tax=Sporosarcina soli TaxID=334736 RepID=A0ABW0TE52_9BACL